MRLVRAEEHGENYDETHNYVNTDLHNKSN